MAMLGQIRAAAPHMQSAKNQGHKIAKAFFTKVDHCNVYLQNNTILLVFWGKATRFDLNLLSVCCVPLISINENFPWYPR